ncbi:fumarylacetoacetate hydrolase family protein [Algibacter amylolyticus]|uniref:Fumarylacetoacetate hydrolase family protein n=1 Tax=Algibacter amylolyticus TaxID=1608400 RepID=A0A5M7B469_9FLAO|nr:fumarylacetoacetate hydrolase family protein [Algibacter amylolyticus]KAA5823600.1 fumarylacetoacetate hydrolase family protein [Algibacter amylolyticus]MBB5267758.1 2-keto-4-pentenoate hydratase/2-oxohepta-3-ene-1,7-dioic acid hydratase in catechol pathway [Algibacter amylolyticus]TSJ74088.1 fumarylacetoacetate hydrolase family protein [Algibacter amylolyticus]
MKIIGIGKNYVNDKSEIAALKTGDQVIFLKAESTLVTDNKNIPFPKITNQLNYEVELVAKIGKSGKDIAESDAASYISEIGIGIDYTAKDVLNATRTNKGPWALAKGFDGASPVNGFKSISNFSDINDINFSLMINGKEVQAGNTSDMIYNFAEIIAFVSKYMTLEPGDLIFTGTPASGAGQNFVGDHLQASIEGELLLDFKLI